MKSLGQLLYLLTCIATAMVGYTIHNSITWSIIDFIFTPLALIKWVICHEINLTIINETFNFLLK